MSWCCRETAHSLQFIWKTANQDLFSFGKSIDSMDQLSLVFSRCALLSYRSRLPSAHYLRNQFWRHIECMKSDDWWHSQQCTAPEQMTKLVLDRSFIEDPLLVKGKIFMVFEKIQNQIVKIWKFYRTSEHRRSTSPPNLGSIGPILRSGEKKSKPYVQNYQILWKLH